jgi:hypothetical protein
MNTNPHNSNRKEFTPGSADETLRIVAGLPAPAGLEERVHAALRAAPRRGRVLAWPEALRPQSSWMRTAAAAAIVFVVAGGGWGVYMHVEPKLPAKVIVMPRLGVSGGFNGANAVRTPQTLTGPTVVPMAAQTPTSQQAKQPGSAKNPAAKAAPKPSVPGPAVQQK